MIIGIGTDIVSIPRIENVLSRFGERFTKKVFTKEEASASEEKSNPAPHLAGCFAAKEAVLKALGTGVSNGITLKDVEVIREKGKRPEVRLYGKGKEMAGYLGATSIHLSLSHDAGLAVAFAVIEG